MTVIKWYSGLVQRISNRNIELAGFGKVLIFIVLGSYFSTQLIFYSLYLLGFALVLTTSFVITIFIYYFKKEKMKMSTIIVGGLAMLAMALLFGMQLPIPFRLYLLILGFILILPAGFQLFGGKR
tara:strand:- start:54556 stop:54930 length:375 start_codon:yes stop_codon:yes gene_type:complete